MDDKKSELLKAAYELILKCAQADEPVDIRGVSIEHDGVKMSGEDVLDAIRAELYDGYDHSAAMSDLPICGM